VESKRSGETVPVFETGRETIFLGSTDLCLIEHIPAVVNSGVTSLKVEGRMKSELYVATVARVYRAAVDRYAEDPDSWEVDPAWLDELQAVSHRPYATGFAFGSPADPSTIQTHNSPVSTCEILAFVQGRRGKRVDLAVRNPFAVGETIEWIAPGDAGGTLTLTEMQNSEGRQISKSRCGTSICALPDTDLPDRAILRRRK
jgi:putative protease